MDWISIEKVDHWYKIRFEGMAHAVNVFKGVDESLEDLIERTRKKYSARESVREEG